jgi:hypothetical protein
LSTAITHQPGAEFITVVAGNKRKQARARIFLDRRNR